MDARRADDRVSNGEPYAGELDLLADRRSSRDEVGHDGPQVFDEVVEQAIARDSIDIVNALDGGQRIEQESRIDARLHRLQAYLRGAPQHAGCLQPSLAQHGGTPCAAHAVVVSEHGAGAYRGRPSEVEPPHYRRRPRRRGIDLDRDQGRPFDRTSQGRRGYPGADRGDRASTRAELADFDHRGQRDQDRHNDEQGERVNGDVQPLLP